MIKYTSSEVIFSEIPDEITLGVNISNCTHNCVGCHSPYLRENIGTELDFKALDELLEQNGGITCILFLGEGNDEKSLKDLISYVGDKHPDLKIGLYSGRQTIADSFYWEKLDYLKLGPYISELGPLNSPTTNQRLYKKAELSLRHFNHFNALGHKNWIDITNEFWMKKA